MNTPFFQIMLILVGLRQRCRCRVGSKRPPRLLRDGIGVRLEVRNRLPPLAHPSKGKGIGGVSPGECIRGWKPLLQTPRGKGSVGRRYPPRSQGDTDFLLERGNNQVWMPPSPDPFHVGGGREEFAAGSRSYRPPVGKEVWDADILDDHRAIQTPSLGEEVCAAGGEIGRDESTDSSRRALYALPQVRSNRH